MLLSKELVAREFVTNTCLIDQKKETLDIKLITIACS